MNNIKSLTYPSLEIYMASIGQPKYRAGQVFKWISMGTGFDEMSDLPKPLREELAAKCTLEQASIAAKQESRKDGTVKYLFRLADGNHIETVLMRYRHGWSICLSTQAGCKMGCVFCASFDPDAARNLTAGEILDQIILAQRDRGIVVSNIVLMGTGEPLDNFDNVCDFLDIVSHPKGMNIGMRHISLSTCGLVPQIDMLAQRKLGITLSVSLHAADDETRSRIMPVNRRYNIGALIDACKRYFEITGRRISFEYAMIGGVNDSVDCAHRLADRLRGMNCHVNLIPLNSVEGSPLKPSSAEDLAAFVKALEQRHITVTVRRSLGGDIDASCGQLRRKAPTATESKND